jgi:hypothetical protein
MGNLQIITAQPAEVKINGKPHTFSLLKIGDWAWLEDWAEGDLRAKGKPVSSEEITRHIFSLAAIPQKTFLMLRRHHPEITIAEAGDLLTLDDYREIERRLYGSVISTDMELLAAARTIAALKAEGKDAAEAEAELKRIIDKAAEEVRQGKARPTESD